jgi:site-specific recombinase XerC
MSTHVPAPGIAPCSTCFAAGLRVAELLTLSLTAITFHLIPAVRVLGKGRRERSLPLWKQTADDLQVWLGVRGDVSAPELFLNAQGRVMTREGFAYVLRKYVRPAAHRCPSLAAKQVTPHVLRHTCAMMILQATGDLRQVSLWHNPALCISEIMRSLAFMFRFLGEAYDGHTLVFRDEMADQGCCAREKEVMPDVSCSSA